MQYSTKVRWIRRGGASRIRPGSGVSEADGGGPGRLAGARTPWLRLEPALGGGRRLREGGRNGEEEGARDEEMGIETSGGFTSSPDQKPPELMGRTIR